MINRYLNRRIFNNTSEMYESLFLKRNVKFINHYNTPLYQFPDENEIKTLKIIEHIWSVGDRFYKLADKYYGDPKDWWVIAKFNNTPTESHLRIGDIVLIPTPIQQVISVMRG